MASEIMLPVLLLGMISTVLAQTTGTVPAQTTGTVLAQTTGTVPAQTTGTVLSQTTGTVPAQTTGTVPALTTSTVLAQTTGTVPAQTTGTVLAQTTGTVPAQTSTVPAQTTGTVPAQTTSTVPAQTTVTVPAQTTGPLYPIAGTASSRSDDGSSPRISLQRPFMYFGQSHNQIYVNHNGHLTFDTSWSRYSPQRIPMHGSRDLIAPFWIDLDNGVQGQISYHQYTSGTVLQQATHDINSYFPGLHFSANWVFVATWSNVQYFPTTGTGSTVQAVLISGGRYSFVLMNYGIIASTTRQAQAGYDTINSTHHFSIPGSFSNNGSNSTYLVFRQNSNVNVAGRWAFRTDHGSRGCTFNGQTVQQGESFWSDRSCAQKCTCTSTGLQCHSQPCSFSQVCRPTAFKFSCQTVQKGRCTISGDPHYYTFDNKVFHFQGTCTYVLSEQCGRGLPYYRVEGKNEHRGSTRVAWTRLVKVHVYNDTIELVKGHRGMAKVNGNFAATPISLSNGNVQVYESGFSVTISTVFGLEVSYDTNSYVRIRLPHTYENATCGLCGNFNNHPEDDFRTRQGELVSSDVVFANSWKASGNDEPACGSRCGGLDCARCTAAQTALYSNPAHCGILTSTSGPFAACHQQLPPQNYLESCVQDLCIGGGYQPILCQALNVYASQCQQNGVQLPSWRRQGFCEIPCPSNSHFVSQGTGCPDTCVNPNSTQNCPLPVQESCICNAGYILSAGVCVPHAQCGCSFEGRYYRSGETVILDEDCGRQCRCSYGSMTCQSHGCGPLESCRVEEGERGCTPDSYGTCWTRGPGSYQTFDGLTYQYPGACRLTLAKVMGLSSHPHFAVTAEKLPRGQQGFARVLKFEAEGTQVSIEMTGSSKVLVDGQKIRLPYSSASNRIQIYHSSIHSIIIRTAFGVTVQTVWPHLVRVTAPGIYNGSLGGLCGNFNGHQHDEFRTPNGVQVDTSQDFGDSWRDGSLAAHCVESNHNNSRTNSSVSRCSILHSPHGPFAQCWAMVDPLQHVDACVEITRASIDPAAALCEFLRDYAIMCQQKGVDLGNWRISTHCAQNCPPNSHYELCDSSCPSACPSLSFPFACDTVCQEGCQCNDGLVLNGNQCVPPTSCGCYHEGRYRQGGERFWDSEECQSSCVCNGTTGAVQCAPNSCSPEESCRVVEGEFGCHPNPHGTCYASGDPHYLTFDGKAFDFQGTCRYVLAKPCNETDELHQFSVEARNEPWRGLQVSITAEVFVNVWGYRVQMASGSQGVVQVNGVTKNLPILLNNSHISIYASGSRTFLIADFGLSVMYDGRYTVSISVPPSYRGKTCGLCGNFNGNPNDEFHTPSGMMVNTPQAFGASWKVTSNYTCTDGCGSSCPRCANERPARSQCELIRAADGPLSFCHEQVDPVPYFNDCVFDVCISGNRGRELLCRAVETYVSACQSANVRIYSWRDNTTCRLDCPANTHYELCGTDCGHTCASNIDATCEQVCSEGCFCDEGFVRSGTRCVPVERCGCQYNGFYYNADESFWTEGCSQRCECHAPNDLRCSAVSCTPTQDCTIRHGELGCFDAMSTCTVWGDPHYKTFDGALAHFQGTCSYIVTESVSDRTDDTGFQVVATNNHRGNNRVSFVSEVDIYLTNQPESVNITIGPSKRVKINGIEVTLPSTAGTLAHIQRQGHFIEVNAMDLAVQFDGRSTLLVRVNNNHESRVTGMCGNLNSDSSDDKVLPNGTPAQNDNQFGQSWKSPKSQPGCGSTDRGTGGGDGLNDCTFRGEYSELCSVITNTSGPFSACHLHSDPQPFYTSCVYDLCLYTPANGMLCSAIAAYERTCSVLELNIPEWRSALHCAESDPCEHLDCAEHEWCGEKDGVYGCFCDEHHHRANNESYDSSIICESSSGTMSVSRCQLFEAGFHSGALHLRDHSCTGTLDDGRLVFNFNNNNHLCGTALKSNGTHFTYENTIQGDVDPHQGLISRQRNIHLLFCCVYPLNQALSMDVGINPVESIVSKKLPAGHGQYHMRMIPYQDPAFHFPLTSSRNIEMEIDQIMYVEVRTEGVDGSQISTVVDSCWATPVNLATYPTRWDLLSAECPNPADGTVELIQNGLSTVSRFSFRMFTFTNFSSIYLHCQVHLCLLRHNNCTAHCYPGHHRRVERDVTYHDTADISLGPLMMAPNRHVRTVKASSASGLLTSLVTLLLGLLIAKTLT
ncbi:alpha-tectorin-like isoform X15 [Trematomus bernacchii]|uniref:alpha-tectorin-like isoform X15 n=1 Tax=Trematomus bernacchii TaxID=40690 RepID=UPI00146F1623|nr:alpha-tectorin-like isoform X15 [Trematomus bernacchii]